MKNIMLDLETLSTRPDAVIVSIGAVVFDADGIGAEFYRRVDLADQMGGHICPSTVQWWMRQSDAARAAFDEDSVQEFLPALMDFRDFLDHYAPDPAVWGNGADFDNVILDAAYRRAGVVRPWGTYKNRCYRTAVKLLDPERKQLVRGGTHHNALDDARSQAEHLIKIAGCLL